MKSGAENKVLSLIMTVAILLTTLPGVTVRAVDSGEPPLGASGVIVAFDALAEDVVSQTATIGTARAALSLPDTLAVTVILPAAPLAGSEGWLEEEDAGESFEQSVTENANISVTWQAEPEYDGDMPGTYIFTPGIPAAYTVSAEPPVITVTVNQADGITLAAGMPVSNFNDLDSAIQSAANGNVITVDTSFTFAGTINIPANKSITIQGSNSTIALTAISGARHFIIQSSAVVTFKDIILDGNGTGGGIDNSGVLIIGSDAKIQKCGNVAWSGGGIYNNGGTVAVNQGGTVSDNTADYGGGIYNCSGGTVAVKHGGTVSGNSASNGGGIANSGTLIVNSGSTVSGNTADNGGGIYNNGGTVIGNGTVSGNIAYIDYGGGIYNYSGIVNINNGGMVSGNTAYAGYGGGICNRDGTVTVNSGGTVSGNIASDGGAIYHYAIGSGSKVCIRYGSEVSGGIAANEYDHLYYEAVFGVTGANGTLNASINGSPISTGDNVPHNSDVTFTAVPNGGYTIKQWSVTQWRDGGSTAFPADNPHTIHAFQTPVKVQVEFEEAGLIPVINTGGEETVTYAGTTVDLSTLSSLFTVDANAGARTYSIETSGAQTGSGSIDGDGKTLTVTKAGTFSIGLVTAATATHEAGAKVTATLTVNKGSQSAPTGLGKADASANGASDGKITGLAANTAYEYTKDGGGYTAATSNASGEITGLTAGSYTVRLAANDLYDASPDSAAVIIDQPAAPVKTASVGTQAGTLTAGTAGSSFFTVTTENFDNGAYTVTLTGAPTGVTAGDVVIVDNSGMLSLSTTAETPAGTYAMAITIGGITSNSFDLVVDTAPTYTVSVISTGTGATGSGSYEAGATVNISAGTPPSGMQFKYWTTSPAVTFTDGTSATDPDVSFIMPAQAVTMTANFEAIPATVTDVAVSPSIATVEKGTTFQFNATVTGTNNPSQSVAWSVDSTAGSTISASGLLSVAVGETAATLTVRATSTVDKSKSGTAAVTVTQSSQTTFIISFNANGGSVSPLTMQTGTDGKLPSLPTPTRNGSYSFDGWFTEASGGFVVTINTVFTANTTLYAHWTYTGGNGSGRSGGEATTGIPATTWLELNFADFLASNARSQNQDYVRTRSISAYGVRAAALKTLAHLRFEHDTIADGAVQLRLYIDNPENITKDVMASGYVKGLDVEWTSGHFGKYFKNSLHVIHMDQQADWGQPIKIAARLDLTGMDTKDLHFYSYDKRANSYRRIKEPAYWIDTNGYMRFTTPFAGDIIVSEGPLECKIIAGTASGEYKDRML